MHKDMILTLEECENLTLLPQKTTAIIASCQSSIDCLMWTMFSFLLRSSPELEHIIVVLNGPDERTGSPTLQNIKQEFLSELRGLKWQAKGIDRDMPLTVNRIWSRIGHSQSLEGAIPWVHTEFYTLAHDDIIILNRDWLRQTLKAFASPQIALTYAPPLLTTGLSHVPFEKSNKINLPHFNSTFLTCKKSIFTELGIRWYGYHLEKEFYLNELVDMQEFAEYHRDSTTHMPPAGMKFGYISMDIGTHAYDTLKSTGYRMASLGGRDILHLTAMSWKGESEKKKTVHEYKTFIMDLQREILLHPTYGPLYKKYSARKLL